MSEYENDLGSCCICEKKGKRVRNLIALDRLAPEPGKGWGCLTCDLPSDGAYAVLCDECPKLYQKNKAAIKLIVSGYPSENKRVPIEKLAAGEFKHNLEAHEIEERYEFV
jgi:hypothetical protein